ncbi:MAG TPA: VCBS repeat-containing protein [Thermoanaerobaculia bacterium]
MKTPRRCFHLLGSLTLLALVFPALATAQPTPLTPVLPVSGSTGGHYLPSVASQPDGDFVVAWTHWAAEKTILFRRFAASGAPLSENVLAGPTQSTQFFQGPEVAVHAATGNFLIIWEAFDSRLLGRAFSREGTPLSGEIELYAPPSLAFRPQLLPSLAATPSGFVAAWNATLNEAGDQGVFARRLDPAGALVGAEIRVDLGTGRPEDPAVAADAAGRFVVVWLVRPGEDGNDLRGRLFDPDGSPLGDELRLDGPGDFLPQEPAVTFGSDGGFLVAWASSSFTERILARAFGSTGIPRGPSARLDVRPPGFARAPDAAPDGHGGFAVFWSYFRDAGNRGVAGRLVDGAGKLRGPAFLFGGSTTQPSSPAVAAGPPGQLTVAWNRINVSSVAGQRFAAPPPTGADPCVLREGRLVCDTLRDESGATLEVPLEDPRPGDLPVLGDFNGDRWDDVCVYRQGSFRCDPDHDGVPEAVVAFGGLPGDVPLLGDVNGDGREDACLRRARRFTCDTARNGGSGEVQILLGLKTDLALMGDVDGDGDGDPCLFRRDRFLCDTAHDGGRAEVAIAFGLPGDVPLLGDADADGDDDPCVFRGDRFLCDTAHDGGAAEIEIPFGEPGATPLLGNMDGF